MTNPKFGWEDFNAIHIVAWSKLIIKAPVMMLNTNRHLIIAYIELDNAIKEEIRTMHFQQLSFKNLLLKLKS